MNPAEAVGHYLLTHLHRLHGNQWLSGPRTPVQVMTSSTETPHWLESRHLFSLTKKQRARLNGVLNVRELFQQNFFRGVVLDSHEGMVAWLEGRYPLQCRHDIPTALEMLDVQCRGERIVTHFQEPDEQLCAYGRHRDACAFTLHDLEHAHKFFGDAESFRGQVRFFRGLQKALPLLQRWSVDAVYVKDLEYLMSDMNSHPVHLIKYLKAIVLSAEIRATGERHPELDGFYEELWAHWSLSESVAQAAHRLNQPEKESEADRISVAGFFTACERSLHEKPD